jgi:hypothetical protein
VEGVLDSVRYWCVEIVDDTFGQIDGVPVKCVWGGGLVGGGTKRFPLTPDKVSIIDTGVWTSNSGCALAVLNNRLKIKVTEKARSNE